MSLLGSPLFFSSGATSGDFYSFEPQGSLRFEDGRSAYLTRTNSSAGNRRTWTFSAWVKRGDLASSQNYILGATTDNYNLNWAIFFIGSNELTFYSYTGTQNYQINTGDYGFFRDTSSWYHLVLAWDTTQATASNRIKLYINGEQFTNFEAAAYPAQNYEEGYINNNIQQDIGKAATAANGYDGYMSEIYFIDGTALDPTSFGETKSGIWIPKDAKNSLTFGTNGYYLPFNSTVTSTGQSTVLYKGTGATRSVEGMGYKPDLIWIKNRSGTTNHNLSDRLRGSGDRLYSNLANASESQTYSGTDNLLSFNSDGFSLGDGSDTNTSGSNFVAWGWDAGADQTATGYGCVTYTGSGTLRPITDIGFSPDLVWFKARDQAYDTRVFDSVRGPTKVLYSSLTNAEASENSVIAFINDGVTANHAGSNGSDVKYVGWAWDAGDSAPASNGNGTIASTVKASTANGFSIVTYTGNDTNNATVGHGLSSTPEMIIARARNEAENWVVYHKDITPASNSLSLNLNIAATSFGSGWIDNATSTVFRLKDGSSNRDNVNKSSSNYIAYCWHSVSGYSKIGSYTGNGSATGPTVTCGFRPAFVMIKRSDSTGNWYIFDVNRDPDNKGQRYLRPNVGNAEGGSGTGQEYVDFQSNGFQIIADSSAFSEGNTSGGTYIYMAFAGGKDTIAPVNTDGSTTSRVKASDDTGFSIVQYEGTGSNATFGHGLSSAPDWVVVKNRSYATNWTVYHSANTGSPGTQYLSLNLADGTKSGSGVVWNSTAPSSSVVSLGTGNAVNRSGDEFIAYCWTATTGKSAFGSYTGNGSSSGPAVTGLGFKPGLLILKNSTDDNTNWITLDNKRDGDSSDVDTYLKPDDNTADVTDNADILVSFDSDGFTLKTSGNDINGSGDTILYMAFADGQSASFFRDGSGNGNNFDPNGLQNYDVVPDNSTNNWCTLNPLSSIGTQSEGNLKQVTGATGSGVAVGSIGQSSGKWYWEVQVNNSSTADLIGVVDETFDSVNSGSYVGYVLSGGKDSIAYYTNGNKYINSTASSYGATFTTGDIIGVALNLDDDEITFYKNGVSQGAISHTFSGGNIIPAVCDGTNSGSVSTFILNFGQDSSFAGTKTPQGNSDDNGRGNFYFSPPSGYLSLCTQNLPTPTIDPAGGETPDENFNTVLYTGNGVSQTDTQAITGVGFSPDFTWIKNRSAGAYHILNDRVRGAGKNIFSNDQAVENSGGASTGDLFTSFDSDGFTVNYQYAASTNSGANQNTNAYVAWNWLAEGTNPSKTYTVKVVSDSGNKYRFDDFGTSAVTLDLQEGGTYVFDQSDSSNSGHPLRFSPTSDGTHGGGTEYTTGVTVEGTPGSAGAKTTIVVAASAPTLYYYCSVHSGMGGQANTNSTHGSSNFDGAVQSTVSANTKAGFSIVNWTSNGSATDGVGHGLGAKPDLAIYKNRGSTSDWYAIFDIIDGSFDRLKPNDNSVYANVSGAYGTMLGTSTISNFGWTNGSSLLAYCFRNIEGYCKIGMYTGNGTASDGTFVYTGFRPAWIMVKSISVASDWVIDDTTRSPYNESNATLFTNLANLEYTGGAYGVDILSNGFKPYNAYNQWNASGEPYFYVAFAEQPFKYANAR